MQLRLVPPSLSLSYSDTGDFLRMKLYLPQCPDYTVFSNLPRVCSQLIHSTQSLSSAISLLILIREKKLMNILRVQFYLKQIKAEINATYLG